MKNDKLLIGLGVFVVIGLLVMLVPAINAQSQGPVTKDICFKSANGNGVKLKGKVTDRGNGFSDFDLKDVTNNGRTTQITFTTYGAGRNGPEDLGSQQGAETITGVGPIFDTDVRLPEGDLYVTTKNSGKQKMKIVSCDSLMLVDIEPFIVP